MPTKNPWVICPELDSQTSLRLFCFPYAGGGTSIFRNWSNRLPSNVQVCPVQLPGRQSRLSEPPFTQISPLVQTLAEELLPFLDFPFAFFGHSMGALISFELARQLRRQTKPSPICLFVSGYHAPQIPSRSLPLHTLPDTELITALRQLNGIPEEILQNMGLIQLMLPSLRADFKLCETYVYASEYPLDCPISVFGGWQDLRINYYDLEGWRNQTRTYFNLRMLPGSHFFLDSAQVLLLQAIDHDMRWFSSYSH